MMRDIFLALAVVLSLTALAACADEGSMVDHGMSGLAGDEGSYADQSSSAEYGSLFDNAMSGGIQEEDHFSPVDRTDSFSADEGSMIDHSLAEDEAGSTDRLSRAGIGSFSDNAMSRGIQDGFPFNPVDRTDSFSADDGKAYSWLDLGQMRGSHQIEWRWHSPDGGLYFTDSSRVDGDGRTHQIAHSNIDIRGTKAASMAGDWNVGVYQDGQEMLNQRFTVVPLQNVQGSYPVGYQAVSSYYGDCAARPPGTYCLVFSDYYTYQAQDAVADGVWAQAGSWNGRIIEVIHGVKADYYHILHTPLLKIVPKSGSGYQGASSPGPAPETASYASSASDSASPSDSNPGAATCCDCSSMGRAGRYDQAVECYSNALKAQPGMDSLWNGMGRMLNQMGRYQDASGCMDHALQMNPNNSDAWKNKGTAMMGMGKYDEAAGCFDRAASMNPSDGQSWYFKGQALQRMQKCSEAGQAFDKAKSLGYGCQA